jgi:hypothetical protein
MLEDEIAGTIRIGTEEVCDVYESFTCPVCPQKGKE